MSASTHFDFNATTRLNTGRRATRQDRDNHKVPAIVYGADKKPQAIVLEQKDVLKALSHEAVFSHILNLIVDGTPQKVILKDLARHSTKPQILHMDFFRIKAGEKITMNVPLHFLGEDECPGVKDGGVVSHLMNDLEIKCLPEKLPEYIEIDVSTLELDHSIHLSQVKLPAGVELVSEITEENDPSVAAVHRPRIEQEPEEEVIAAPEEEGAETEATQEDSEAKTETDTKEEPKS